MASTLLLQGLMSSNLRRDLIEIVAAVDANEPGYVLDALLLRARTEVRKTWSVAVVFGDPVASWFEAIESDRAAEPEARRRVFEAVDHVYV